MDEWFLDALDPASAAASNVCRAYRVLGPLDVDALRRSWAAAVRRRFPSAGGRSFVRLSVVDAPQRAARARDRYAAAPLDGGPARLVVLRVAEAEHVVLLVVHQAAGGQRLLSALVRELSGDLPSAGGDGGPAKPFAGAAGVAKPSVGLAAQPALGAGPPALDAGSAGPLAPDQGAGGAPELGWWVSALTPHPADPVLPTDRARPAGPAWEAGVVRFDWGDLARGVRAVGAADVALLAAFTVLLWRYAGGEPVAVAVPGLGRSTDPMVLRIDAGAARSFRALVGEVARLRDEALRHDGPVFAEIVHALGQAGAAVERDPRRVPLCDLVFSYADEPPLELPGCEVGREPVHPGMTRADLALTVRPELVGELAYRAALFDAASARGILGQLRTLLAAAVADPDQPLDTLPLDPPEAAATALREANRLAAAAPAARPAHELVYRHARLTPDAVAVAWDGATVSYQRLYHQAGTITAALAAKGGTAVAVRLQPGSRQIAALLGVLGAGAHLLWLGAGDAGERGRAVLADLRPSVLVTEGELAGDELATWYRDKLGGRVLDLDAMAEQEPADGTRVRMDARAYVAYTSGSTGRPKGIAQTHAALAQFTTWMGAAFGLGRGARVAQWVAPEHDPALCEVFATLVAGGTLQPVPARFRANPDKLARWLVEQRITVLQTVPSFARELLRTITRRGLTTTLDHLLLMGEALPGELVGALRAALPGTRLVNLYGPTETIAATWHEITGDTPGTVPIGLPIPGRQVLLLDDEDRPCPTGVTGELVVRSPYVTPGYLGGAGDPAVFLSPRTVRRPGERTYRTGDLARRRWDGLLEFRGRKDFQVKLAGNRIELTDVEAALAAHPSVLECAVVPLTDPQGLVTHLVAHVVPQGDAGGVDAWRAQLRERFGRTALPVLFRTAEGRLPRTVGGKVDRRRLPAARPPAPDDSRPPRSAVELHMAAIWSELLGHRDFTAGDSFFAAGGHSLLLPRLVSLARERLGADLTLWQCLATPTLAALSELATTASPQVA